MRTSLTLLEQQLDESIGQLKSLKHSKTKAIISDMVIDIQIKLADVLRAKDQGENPLIDDIEKDIERIRGLLRHHTMNNTLGDYDELLRR